LPFFCFTERSQTLAPSDLFQLFACQRNVLHENFGLLGIRTTSLTPAKKSKAICKAEEIRKCFLQFGLFGHVHNPKDVQTIPLPTAETPRHLTFVYVRCRVYASRITAAKRTQAVTKSAGVNVAPRIRLRVFGLFLFSTLGTLWADG
jgi:hypothetical protein